jgi:tetratricopeptide (TPR) repeat protein
MSKANAAPHPREIGAIVTLLDRGDPGEAERRVAALLTVHPGAGILWKILGVALLRQGKDALHALRRATELLPRDGEAHGNLGAALHDRGQWPQALVSLRRALEIQPHNVEALVDAAGAMRALGRSAEAVPLYQRALQLNPGLAEARNDMGNALLELGRYDDAIAAYRMALAIRPHDAQILCNIANAQRLRGQREEAAASYRKALASNPRSVEALNGLGDVLSELGARREAMSVYARAVELEPDRPESHHNLANALFDLRKLEEAAASYTRVLALQPRNARAHLSLGVVHRTQRRHAEAEASCQAALAVDPGYVEALSLLGELRADRGRFAEAEELFHRAIAINPDFSFAFSSIATHRRMTRDDGAWLAGAQALLAKRPPVEHEISLNYALGKYFDDIGQFDDAFGCYREANELTKRRGPGYDGTKLTRGVDDIIRSFDAPFVRRCETDAPGTELPVFVVGMPRSGTSLTEQILASHPAVAGAGEVVFWDAAFAAYRRAGGEAGGQGLAARATLLADVTRGYLERLAPFRGEAARVIDKMPANFWYAGLIHAAFPRARIIHMRRHPIDTCLSIYFQNFFNVDPYANDLHSLAHYYAEYLRITDHWRAVLPARTLLEVPYEGLVEDQEGWTRRMVEFLGLAWDPKCLDFHQTERVVITASKWQVRQKIHASSAGRWRNYEKFVGPLRRLLDDGQPGLAREEERR